ncbi:MAG: hypothetical protein J6T19_07575 [Paludibacteraceae bacterium]|nr:hypothetical protein [Paludibacteraceae bacterium]
MAHKGIKIASITVGAILFILLIFWLIGNMWITNIMDGFLRRELGQLESVYVDYKKLNVDIFKSSAQLDDVVFCTLPDSVLPEDEAGVKVKVDRMVFSGCNFIRILNRNELSLHHITLNHPEVVLNMPLEKSKEVEEDEEVEEVETKEEEVIEDLEDANEKTAILRELIVKSVRINDGSLRMRDITNKMTLQLDSLNVRGYELGYHFSEEGELTEDGELAGHMLYNDSLYSLSLSNLSFVSPDGLFRADIKKLHTANAGPLTISGLHAFNTCEKGSLSKLMGGVKVTWVNMSLNEITTSPVNLIRQALSETFELDSVHIAGNHSVILRDERYPAKEPFPMPQDILLGMDKKFVVNHVTGDFPGMEIQVLTTHLQNCGILHLGHLNMKMSNVSNVPQSHMNVVTDVAFGEDGIGKITMNMTMNKAANFDFAAHIKGLKGSMFSDFLHPLFGAELQCNINDLTTSYHANREEANGTFCMQYDSVNVHVFKEDAPYTLIAKRANAINMFAPMIIQKSNPRRPNTEPVSYEVHAKRDPMSHFVFFVMGPMMDGCMQTLLPGFVVKSIHKKQEKGEGMKM